MTLRRTAWDRRRPVGSLVAALLVSVCDLNVATQAQLATLTSAAQRSAYRFELSVNAGLLQVRLLGENGRVRSRDVAATGVCEDDATVAAVILSSLMAQPEPRPVPRPKAVRPAVEKPVDPVVEEAVEATVEAQPDQVPAVQLEDPELPPLVEPAAPARWSWSASVEGGAVIGGGGAPAMTLRAEGGMRFGLVADVTFATDREQVFGENSLFWSRTFGGLGARVRWLPAKRWLIDAMLGVAAGWVTTRGAVTSGQADAGACGGVVVGGYELGAFGVFLSARMCGWPWAPLTLPVVDGGIGVGLMWGGHGG